MTTFAHTTARLTELLAQLDLTALEDAPAAEGLAMRHAVQTREGERVLLYLWCAPQAAARAIRVMVRDDLGEQLFAVPEVFAHDASKAWCLVRHPEGQALSTWLDAQGASHFGRLAPTLARPLVESLGVLLRKLHSIDSPGVFGEIPDDVEQLAQGSFHTFNGWVAAQLERFIEAINHAQELDPDQRLECLGYLGDLRHELSAFHPRHPAVFSHGSLGAENLWVGPAGQEIVGITGFDRARYLPAEADLATVLWIEGLATLDDHTVRCFYRGYGAAHTMDVQRRERFYRRLASFDVITESRRRKLDMSTLIALAGPRVNPFD